MKIKSVDIQHKTEIPSPTGAYLCDELTANVSVEGYDDFIEASVLLEQGNIDALSDGLEFLGDMIWDQYKELTEND